MTVLQKSEAIDRFRDDMFDASDKINGTVSLYDAMRIFNKYLEAIRGEWIEHREGVWNYAKCSKCGRIHDAQYMYCPSCGCVMDGERILGRMDDE